MIKEFQLGGKIYKVEEVDNIGNNTWGRCMAANNKIEISKYVNNELVPNDSKEQTFYHELMHCVLDDLGYHDLSNDETLVQSVACLLHQFELTKK